MEPNTPSVPPPFSTPSAPPPAPKKTRWLLCGCGALIALFLGIIATVAITVWWIHRPIKPVVLSASEKATVQGKLDRLSGGSTASPATATANQTPDRRYVRGAKALKLTEREINGLLNANTELGETVRLEFVTDAINAYVTVPIPQDFPIGGGKTFRGCARFRMSLGNGGTPYAILDDVTVFGLSLPKAWLGGLKGENLIGRAMGGHNGSPVFHGVKSLRIESGALVLELED